MKELLSPKEFAQAIGVSQSSIKRWTDGGLIHATRTAGGHRRIHISEAIRFLRENETVLVQPQILGLPENTAVGRASKDLDRAGERLAEFLREGKAEECRSLVLSLYLSGVSVADLGDRPIRAAMVELGKLWNHHADRGIYLEHRATQICVRICHELASMVPNRPDGPVALGGAPEGDTYQLPSLLVSTALAEVGYQTVNLGPSSPFAGLLAATVDLKPTLVWLSVSHADRIQHRPETLRKFQNDLRDHGAVLVVGGRESDLLGLQAGSGLHRSRSLNELAAFAQGLCLEKSPGKKTKASMDSTDGARLMIS